MPGRFHRLAWAGLVLACLTSPGHAGDRALTVDDIVSTEAFGRASFAPDGRWAVYEKRGPYEAAPRFDMGPRSQWAITDLWRVDLSNPGTPQRLLPGEPVGLIRGSWSPNGSRMLVYRLRDRSLEAGIVDVADRSVAWTGLTPELPLTGAMSEWISDDQLLLTVRPDDSLPWIVQYYGASQPALTAAWARTTAGQEASRTVVDTRAGVATPAVSPPAQALMLIDLRSGDQRRLARGEIRDFALSPDGRHVAIMTGAEPNPVRPESIVQVDIPTRQRLNLIDLGTGASRPLAEPLDVAPHLLRWSPDSRTLLVWARSDSEGWSDGKLLGVRADGGYDVLPHGALAPRPSGEAIDNLRGVQADWIGLTPVLYARPSAATRFDWYALGAGREPERLTLDIGAPPGRLSGVKGDEAYLIADGGMWSIGDGRARRLSQVSKPLREVVIGDTETPFRLLMNAPPARDWTTATLADGRVVTVTSTGDVHPLGKQRPGGDPARVLASAKDAALVLRREGLSETLSLIGLDAERDLDHVNADLEQVVLSEPAAVVHTDTFGRPTESRLFLPPGGAAAARGLVIEVYPGALDSGAWGGPLTLTYGLRPAVLAGAGYAVLSPSMPIDRADSTSPRDYLRAVDAAVDATLAAYPDLPEDRMAVVGHSLGGYTALAIAARSRRYRSYVSWAGLSDLFTHWGEFSPISRILPEYGHSMRMQQGWVETKQGGIDGPPWEDPLAYIELSPFMEADRIKDPVLLITADKDFVPMSESENMFSALYRLGETARLVTYWGEDHILWSPANIRDLYAQIFAWLDETLTGGDSTSGASGPGG